MQESTRAQENKTSHRILEILEIQTSLESDLRGSEVNKARSMQRDHAYNILDATTASKFMALVRASLYCFHAPDSV